MPALVWDQATRLVVSRLARTYSERGAALYLVGGVVRDMLLGAPPAEDLDFATSAEPPQTKAALRATGAEAIYDVGEKFGTIGGVLDGLRCEITTYRAEAYTDGSRKPSVSFRGRLEDDLGRRDFTVNAIALDPADDRIVDPFGGQDDLQRRVLRAVGDPVERFREDPLRLLRAVRLAGRLGFDIDAATASAAAQSTEWLASISRERVRDELNRMLLSPAPAWCIARLVEFGLAQHSLPDLLEMRGMDQEAGRHKDVFAHTLQVLDRTPPRLIVRWAALLHDVAKPRTLSVSNGQVHFFGHDRVGAKMARNILLDLRQESALVDRVSQLVGLHLRANAYAADWTDGAVRRFVREAGDDDALVDLLALSRADVTSARADRRMAIARSAAELEERICQLRAREDIASLRSPLDGNDLMVLFGRPPGPWIRPIKDRLLDMVLDGELGPDDVERAKAIAKRLHDDLPASPER